MVAVGGRGRARSLVIFVLGGVAAGMGIQIIGLLVSKSQWRDPGISRAVAVWWPGYIVAITALVWSVGLKVRVRSVRISQTKDVLLLRVLQFFGGFWVGGVGTWLLFVR